MSLRARLILHSLTIIAIPLASHALLVPPLVDFEYLDHPWLLLAALLAIPVTGWLVQRALKLRAEVIYLAVLAYVTAAFFCFLLAGVACVVYEVGYRARQDAEQITVPVSFACAGVICLLLRRSLGRWIERNRLVPEDVLVGVLWTLAVTVVFLLACAVADFAYDIFGSEEWEAIACAWPVSVVICLGSAKLWRWYRQRRYRYSPERVRSVHAKSPNLTLLRAVHDPDQTDPARETFRAMLTERGYDDGGIKRFLTDPDEHSMPAFAPAPTPGQAIERMRSWRRTNRSINIVLVCAALTAVLLAQAGLTVLHGRLDEDADDDLSDTPTEWIAEHTGLSPARQGVIWTIAVEALVAAMALKGVLWRKPARILLLRPFGDADVSKGLRRFSARNLIYFGHVFTLADRYLKESVFISLLSTLPRTPGDLFRLVFYPFVKRWRRRVVVQEESDFVALRARLWSRWLLNTVWRGAFRDKIHKVRTNGLWWRRCIDLLAVTCEVIVVDLNLVKAGTRWELDKIFEEGLLPKCLFIAQEEQLDSARAILRDYHGAWPAPAIHVYDRRGRLGDPAWFQQNIAQCLSLERPAYTGPSVVSGHARAAVGLSLAALAALACGIVGAVALMRGEWESEWFAAVCSIIATFGMNLLFYLPVISVPLLLAAWHKIHYSGGRLHGRGLVLFLGGFWLPLLLAFAGLIGYLNYEVPALARAAVEDAAAKSTGAVTTVPVPTPPPINTWIDDFKDRQRAVNGLLSGYKNRIEVGQAMDLLAVMTIKNTDAAPEVTKEMLARLFEGSNTKGRTLFLYDTLVVLDDYHHDAIDELRAKSLRSDVTNPDTEAFMTGLADRAIPIVKRLMVMDGKADSSMRRQHLERLAGYYFAKGDFPSAVGAMGQRITTQRAGIGDGQEGDEDGGAKSDLADLLLVQSRYQLFDHRFAEAEASCHEAVGLRPDLKTAADRPLAHALMFLDHADEARLLHELHASDQIDDESWSDLVADDFRDFWLHGMVNPHMDEYAKLLDVGYKPAVPDTDGPAK